MKMLQGVISESGEYYSGVKGKIEKRLAVLPKGSIKERRIGGNKYYYLQFRNGSRVIHKYLGRIRPDALIKQIKERDMLKEELHKVNEALKIVARAERKKRGRNR